MLALSEFVTIKRRYSRSVNLERDFEIPDSLIGYILTSRAIDSTCFSNEAAKEMMDSQGKGPIRLPREVFEQIP
jgi:hypothetical protein